MFSFKRATLTWYDVRVGIFIILGISVTFVAIFFIQPIRHFRSTYKVRSLFSTIGGLTQGAPVAISGVQVGTVTSIRVIRDPSEVPSNQIFLKDLSRLREKMDRVNVSAVKGRAKYKKLQQEYSKAQAELKRVSVLMDVSSAQRDLVGATSVALIKNQGLIGEKYIDISTSGPDAPKLSPVVDSTGQSAVEIAGQEPIDMNAVLQNASGAASSFENLMNEVDADISQGKGTLGKLIKDPSVHDGLNQTLKETARATRYSGDLMKSIKEGKGTLGKIIADPSLFNSANNVLKSIDQGNGTLGKLIHDPAVYHQAADAMKGMNSLFSTMNEGHGTFQKLLKDSTLYENTNRLMKNSSTLLEAANQGKGSLGKFANDDAFYRNTNKAMAGLAEVTDKINKGQGTIGLLLQDKRVYDNLNTFSEEMVKFIQDFKKNPKKYLTIQLNVIKLF